MVTVPVVLAVIAAVVIFGAGAAPDRADAQGASSGDVGDDGKFNSEPPNIDPADIEEQEAPEIEPVDERPPEGEYVPGELMVTYKTLEDRKNAKSKHGDVDDGVERKTPDGKESRQTKLKVKEGDEQKEIEKLKRRKDVEVVEYNGVMEPTYLPNDPEASSGRQNNVLGSYSQYGHGLASLWNNNQTWAAGQWANIAIIDTGFNMAATDLNVTLPHTGSAKIADYYNFTDDTYGNMGGESGANHGNAMASIASGYWKNSQQISGVAPLSQLYLYKAANPANRVGVGIQETIDAINYACSGTDATKAHIINMSFASDTGFVEFQTAVTNATNNGCMLIASGGQPPPPEPTNYQYKNNQYPAAYTGVFGTAWGVHNAHRSAKAGYCGTQIDWTAQGNYVKAVDNTNTVIDSNGTSGAAAIASGIAAIIHAGYGGTPSQKYSHIASNVTDFTSPNPPYATGYDQCSGYGYLDAYKAAWLTPPAYAGY